MFLHACTERAFDLAIGVKNMRHAYLIIAHRDFDVLKLLISSLDDERNDIYVHIDKKVKILPDIKAEKSILYILPDRVDVRWGNYSQIESEYALWESAMKNGPYEFYHLISGTHLPLKSQDEIHAYFAELCEKSIFSNLVKREGDYQEVLKLHRLNVCTRTHASSKVWLSTLSQFIWKSFLALQRWMKITVNDGVQFYWANNWCSLSQEAVAYLVENKGKVHKRYRWSFCGDEWFAPTELMNSALRDEIISIPYLYNTIGRNNASELNESDITVLESGDYCFARKFSSKHPEIINTVLCRLKNN